jgi:hypothetical protein
MKKFILSLFFVIFALFNVCGEDLLHPVIRDDIDEDIKKIEQALVDYVLYPELVERGFDIHRLDNMKIDGEMFEYIESFFRPNDEKGWCALDNHHELSIKDENGKEFRDQSYKRAVIFSNEYGTKDELLKKGYVENETMFYYPSNGEKDWRVGKWQWSYYGRDFSGNNKGKKILKYNAPSRFSGTSHEKMAFRNSKTLYGEQGRQGRWFGIVETKKSVIIDFDFIDDYINEVKFPKKDYLIIDLSCGNGGNIGVARTFAKTLKKSKYKKIIIITNDTTSASENLVQLLSDDQRVIKIGLNTNGRYRIITSKGHRFSIEKEFYFGSGEIDDAKINSDLRNIEGIGFYPDIWADNFDDVLKNIWNITGDYEIQR